MKTPETFTCPKCGSAWPWRYDYCPKDGRALRALKKELLKFPKGRKAPKITSIQNLPKLLADIYGHKWLEQHPIKTGLDIEDIECWLGQLNKPHWQEAVILRYGLDGHGERKHRQISHQLGVSSTTISERLAKAFRNLRRPAFSRQLLEQ